MKQSKLTRRPESLEGFIASAPDAGEPGETADEKAIQITFTLPPDLLEAVNKKAKSMSLSRAAFMKMTLNNAVKE